jgi:hypothetical protein
MHMDNFNWNELLDLIVPALIGVLGAVIGMLYGRLKELVKQTDAKWDDQILQAIEDGLGAGREEAKAAIKAHVQKNGSIANPDDVDSVV